MLTVKQVAELLQVNPETVKRMIYRGEILAVKVGSRWRISKKEVERFRR
jgi:excisionase family DNA binding protein